MQPPAPAEKKKQPPFPHPLLLSTNTNPHQNRTQTTKKEVVKQKPSTTSKTKENTTTHPKNLETEPPIAESINRGGIEEKSNNSQPRQKHPPKQPCSNQQQPICQAARDFGKTIKA
jgi:hypothetical protein